MQPAAEPVLRGNVVAACEVVVDPEDDEAGLAVPRPTTPSPLVPRLAVPRLDASGAKTIAVAAVVADKPVVVLHGAKVPPCVPIELAVLPRAPIELAIVPCVPIELVVLPWVNVGLAAAIAPRLSPPPSNVGSAAVLGLAPGHAVEFASPKTLLVFCDMPAPLRLGCNGEVACKAAMGGTLVCATLLPMPGPASAMTKARKPLIRVCGFAMVSPQRIRAAETRRCWAKSRNRPERP